MKKNLSKVILSAMLITGGVLGNSHLIHASSPNTKVLINYLNRQFELDLSETLIKQVNNISLIPLRTISESLGSSVNYNSQTGEIYITNESGSQVKLLIDNTSVQKGNQVIALEVAPRVYNSTTYVPLRFVSEALGYDVKWDAKAQTITLSKDYIESKSFIYNYSSNALLSNNKDGKFNKLAEGLLSSDLGYLTIEETQTTIGNYILTINNNYGEPSLNDEHLTFYISGDQVIDSTHCNYWRLNNATHQNYGSHTVALTNGSEVKLYDDTSLTFKQTIDLKPIIAPIIQEYVEELIENTLIDSPKEELIESLTSVKYTLEGVGENFILVKGGTGALTLIYLDSKEVIPLYKHLLSPEDLKLLDHGYGFFEIGDSFTFIKQEGNKLYFNVSMLNDKQYVYEIK